MRHTTVYYTLVVERIGPSGPDNERRIDKFVETLEGDFPKDKHISMTVQSHDYEVVTETV